MVEAHVPKVQALAVNLARRRRLPPCIEPDDLIGEGFVGLVQAAAAYDAARGIPFWPFAVRRVRGSMLDYLRQGHGARRYRESRPVLDSLEAAFSVPASGPSPCELAMRTEVRRIVWAQCRTAQERFVAACLWRGWTVQEVATRIDRTEARVRKVYTTLQGRARAVIAH